MPQNFLCFYLEDLDQVFGFIVYLKIFIRSIDRLGFGFLKQYSILGMQQNFLYFYFEELEQVFDLGINFKIVAYLKMSAERDFNPVGFETLEQYTIFQMCNKTQNR